MEASEFIRLAEPDRSTTLDACTPEIEPDKAEHNLSNTEEYFQRDKQVKNC